jgi:hypothetical protein
MLPNTGPMAFRSFPFFDLLLFADGSRWAVSSYKVPAVVDSNLRHCRDDPQHGPAALKANFNQFSSFSFSFSFSCNNYGVRARLLFWLRDVEKIEDRRMFHCTAPSYR